MENYEELDTSLPFIDDSLTDDEVKNNYYNLKIIENYQNKNRNIEITNESPDDTMGQSLSPVAPLAEETEISDSKLSDSLEEEMCRHVRRRPVSKKPGMKLIVKGWNSSISIQGLDNKSSITFKRKNEKIQQEKIVRSFVRKEKENEPVPQVEKEVGEKPRKGRWKLLTRSLISKSSKFERKGLDERYPKYVLLKNEEEAVAEEKECYPKMVVFDRNKSKGKLEKENLENKSEFNFKRPFKNKTKPIVPIEEILGKSKKEDLKKPIKTKEKIPLTERSQSENRNVMFKKRVVVERRKSFTGPPQVKQKKTLNNGEMKFQGPPQVQVFKEIKDIFEDTLKLCPDVNQPAEENPQGNYQPQCCQFSCHDPCCFASAHDNHPPMYIPVYTPYGNPRHFYKNSNTQTNEEELGMERAVGGNGEAEMSYHPFPFSLLNNFFPRVVIMKTFGDGNLGNGELEDKNTKQQPIKKETGECRGDDDAEEKVKTPSTLEVPEQDLSLKSKMVLDESCFEPEVDPFLTGDVYLNCLTLNGMCSSDEEQKPKTDDSEATEYLHYSESDVPGNESTKPTFTWETSSENNTTKTADGKSGKSQDEDENSKNCTLTKVGYKMYDNLTKLSLKRETEVVDKPETSGCGCTGNGTQKSPYNITLDSNNGVVKVTVPDNQLNLKFVNSGTADVLIGLSNEKKLVAKDELWHPDNGQRQLVVAGTPKPEVLDVTKGPQKISLSLGDNKDVVLSIEMEGKEQKEDKIKERSTKEVKVGTDDFHLAGGDFSCTLGGNYKNLSPRTGQLLKNLQQRLEFGEKERKFLQDKINERLTDHKFKTGILPGIFLVKQISPRSNVPDKKTLPASSLKKSDKVGELREYYCEECLATMRIFEDENPSVKSMVDKFETIIQLESF